MANTKFPGNTRDADLPSGGEWFVLTRRRALSYPNRKSIRSQYLSQDSIYDPSKSKLSALSGRLQLETMGGVQCIRV